jgi:hypothetical protein
MKLMMVRFALALAVTLFAAQTASAALFELITATDPVASYTASTGVITSGASDAVVLPGTSLGSGNTLSIEMQMLGAETGFTFGTLFEATPPAGVPELIIRDGGGAALLTADLLGISVTGMFVGPAGNSLTSVTLGDVSVSSTHIELTGGSEAGNFGGIGSIGELSVFLNEPSEDFAFGSFFDLDFTAQMNVQLRFHTPEPGTGLLVAMPLAGMAWWRRRVRTKQ